MNTRSFLLLLIGLLAFMAYLEWQKDYAPPPQPEARTPQQSTTDNGSLAAAGKAPAEHDGEIADLPDVPDFADDAQTSDASGRLEPAAENRQPDAQPALRASRRISIDTDVLNVDLDANGGTLVDLRLKDYPVSVDQPDTPFELLVEDLPRLFVAQAGLISADRPAPNHRSDWEYERDSYTLEPGEDTLEVPLTWRHES